MALSHGVGALPSGRRDKSAYEHLLVSGTLAGTRLLRPIVTDSCALSNPNCRAADGAMELALKQAMANAAYELVGANIYEK